MRLRQHVAGEALRTLDVAACEPAEPERPPREPNTFQEAVFAPSTEAVKQLVVDGAGVSTPRTPRRCGDEKVANREIRVWHFVIENGY